MLTNNASFLLLIGYIMLTRLNFNLAVKQFIFATVGLIITAFIPYIMLKWKKMKDCGVLYGVIGLLFLLTVFIPGLGSEKYLSLIHISKPKAEAPKVEPEPAKESASSKFFKKADEDVHTAATSNDDDDEIFVGEIEDARKPDRMMIGDGEEEDEGFEFL